MNSKGIDPRVSLEMLALSNDWRPPIEIGEMVAGTAADLVALSGVPEAETVNAINGLYFPLLSPEAQNGVKDYAKMCLNRELQAAYS